MKRRKNAVYTGQSKRVSTGETYNRDRVDAFYKKLNALLGPSEEIEIIPPEQVHLTLDPAYMTQDLMVIMLDYCIRKILPEVTGLFAWGDEVTRQLRALAPIVDTETAKTAAKAAGDAFIAYSAAADAAYAARAAYPAATSTASKTRVARATVTAALDVTRPAHYVADFWGVEGSIYSYEEITKDAHDLAEDTARCVFYALFTCIEVDDEAAYNRIIDLTNEMLESL